MTELVPVPGGYFPERYRALNAAWQRALSAALCLPEDRFQVVLGTATRDAAHETLQHLCDATPGTAPAVHVAHLGSKRRSAGYRRLLEALQSDTELALQTRLGRQYRNWIHSRATPGRRQTRLFHDWARASFPAETAADLIAAFATLARADPLIAARDRLAAELADGTDNGTGSRPFRPGYSPALHPTHGAFFTRPGCRVALDSDAAAQPPAPPCGPGCDRILPGAESGIFDPLERKLLAARITVDGSFGDRAVVSVDPCAWYDPQLVDAVRDRPDDPDPWEGGSAMGGWRSFFGPGAALERSVARLVFVRGCDLNVTFHTGLTGAEQAALADKARQGVWPIYAHGAPPGHRVKIDATHPDRVSVRLWQVPRQIICLGRITGGA